MKKATNKATEAGVINDTRTNKSRTVKTAEITEKLALGIDRCLKNVDERVLDLLKSGYGNEKSKYAKWALKQIIENDEIAASSNCYACQDTGIAMIFVRLGQDAKIDGDLNAAIDEGVRLGYANARKSITHPLTRQNTGDNTPAVVYFEVALGNGLRIDFLAKGAGSENMGGTAMLTPSKGKSGIIEAVKNIVSRAGANPCPPILLGVGIGGTMDKAALLSKKALLRPVGTASDDPETANLESEILSAVNELGIGVQGLGGNNTALACAVEVFPTHIGMLPVAVTIQCHSARHCSLEW